MLGDDADADDMTYNREVIDDEGALGEGKENGPVKTSVKEINLNESDFDMDAVGKSQHLLALYHRCTGAFLLGTSEP